MAVTGIDGLISGMNTSDIIDSMITADRQSVVQLERKQELFSARQEAVQALNLRMLGADLALTKLKRASTFEAKQTASSDESVLSGTAFARAAAGTYDLEVKQLAQAHQIATTNGVSSKESPNFQGGHRRRPDHGCGVHGTHQSAGRGRRHQRRWGGGERHHCQCGDQ
ncbi:MAG: flagellar cap protein FliD N-terminal domain-containing protein [Planctomycetota bacterium]